MHEPLETLHVTDSCRYVPTPWDGPHNAGPGWFIRSTSSDKLSLQMASIYLTLLLYRNGYRKQRLGSIPGTLVI
jgi:hypothetical protein